MSGVFITVEGPDGSGKTSVIKNLVPQLERLQERAIVLTREPGGGSISEQIREVILNVDNTEMDHWTEALLYAASRRQHVAKVLEPALENDCFILCDRYVDSSLVYQGIGRGLGVDNIYDINRYATQGLEPDLTLLLDVPSEIGLSRIQSHRDSDKINRLDKEALTFHQKVREGYLMLAEKYPERIQRIDASQSVEDVTADCLFHIQKYLQQKKGE